MTSSSVLLNLIVGLVLLLAGRNVFWFSVGTVGFLLGLQWVLQLGFSNPVAAFISALACGFLGIILALSFEWAAVVFGLGFLGGGYLLVNIFSKLPEGYVWALFVIGGIVGACLMVVAFDLTLILISSLLGAMLIVSAYSGEGQMRDLLFVAISFSGIFVQCLSLKAGQGRNMEVRD